MAEQQAREAAGAERAQALADGRADTGLGEREPGVGRREQAAQAARRVELGREQAAGARARA